MTIDVPSSDGLLWRYRGADTDDHLALGGHEVQLRPVLEAFGDSSKDAVVVGAHVGTWAVRLGAFEWADKVWAFEANPLTYDVLRQNIGLNGLGGRVLAIPAAVYDQDGVRFGMVDEKGMNTGGSTRLAAIAGMPNLAAFDSVSLDTYFACADGVPNTAGSGHSPIGLVLIDVEGAEAHVLRGARELISAYRPKLLIELHENHPGVDANLREQVYEILWKLGYTWASIAVGVEEYLIAQHDSAVLDEPESVQAGTSAEVFDELVSDE
jgi:FkbM family methyltransferase